MRVLPFAVLMLAACASPTPYTPDPGRPFEPIAAEFQTTNGIALINAQPDSEQVVSEGEHWLIDYHAWTDVAIAIAQRELTARGMTVDAQSARRLQLSIESANTEVGWWTVASTIVMRVETGDGYTATFRGENSSAMVANPKRQIDGAMMRAVVAMLSDAHIVAYLTR
jgi:hypothetical protein